MRLWIRQIRWECVKLCAQRRVWLGFAICALVEIVFALLFKIPQVRALAEGDLRLANVRFSEAFSGLTMAAHLIGEASMLVGALFVAMVAGGIVSGEAEEGTLRMVLSRPVPRTRVWLQRLLVSSGYTLALSAFITATSLMIGLAFEGPGRLLMVMPRENVTGDFSLAEGLVRYALASTLLAASMLTISLFAFALSCSHIKPAAAAALALTVFIADGSLRQMPAAAPVKKHFLMTRMISWLHAFDGTIPSALIRQNYTWLLILDAALIGLSCAAFRRLELKP